MRAPDYLTGDAKKFWGKHARRLEKAGMLTEADADSFALCCMTWANILQAQYNPDPDPKELGKQRSWLTGQQKQYQALAKQFGLMPKDRRKSGLDTDEITPDEFGL